MIKKLEHYYIVHHVRDEDSEDEDIKLIGIFSSMKKAQSSIDTLSEKPGFRNHMDRFYIDKYEVDKVHWDEGFVCED